MITHGELIGCRTSLSYLPHVTHHYFSATNHIVMNRFKLIFGLWILFFSGIGATPQHPDLINIDGDTTMLVSWLPKGPLDKDLLRQQKPDSYSTACWDGFYLLWEIRNDSLFLNSFRPCSRRSGWYRPAGAFYPGESDEVFADWMDKEIYVASDTLITWHDVYPIYAEETGYAIKAGIVGETKQYDNRKSRTSDQSDIAQYVYDNLPWGTFPDTNRIMVISFLVDSLERPTDVTIPRSNGPLYDSLGLKLLEQLPPIPVYYFHGKPMNSRWNLPIRFSQEGYLKQLGGSNRLPVRS